MRQAANLYDAADKWVGFVFDLKIASAATRLCSRLKGPSQQAERRCCYGGRPAWMPGELRRAMDGPSQRAPITVPE